MSKLVTINDIPGIGPATAEKLTESGFDTVESIAVATPGQIVDASGVSEAIARKAINTARDSLDMGFQSGDEIMKKRNTVDKISTGSKDFDAIMGGGIESGAITEAHGEFGSGKTQLAHMVLVNTLLKHKESYGVFIDTENTFRPERINQLTGENAPDVLKRIKIARAYNSDHQLLLAEKVQDLIKEGNDIKILIVDSLTAHFRAEFIGRGTLAERQQKLNKHMHTLLKVADLNNLVVYVTNQVMSKPDTYFGDPNQAIGGHIVAHAATFRIYLRKGKKGSRVAKLIDSPNLPDAECNFYVREDGLEDV